MVTENIAEEDPNLMDEVEAMKTGMSNKYSRYFMDLRNMDNL